MQPGKSSYQKGDCQGNRPVDQRATKVRRDYKKRAAGLDQTQMRQSCRGRHKWSGVRWVHSRRPLEHSTPATPSPLSSERPAKSMRMPASSSPNSHASLPRLTLWQVDVATGQPQQERGERVPRCLVRMRSINS